MGTCPATKPAQFSTCDAALVYPACDYDVITCAVTGESHHTTHVDCVSAGYWSHTTIHVVCPEAMSPMAPPAAPPPVLAGMNGDAWASLVSQTLNHPLLGHVTTADDVHVAFGDTSVGFCVQATASDTLQGLLTSIQADTFVPALGAAAGVHLSRGEEPALGHAAVPLALAGG